MMVLGKGAASYERGTPVRVPLIRGDHRLPSGLISHKMYQLNGFRRSTSPQNRQLDVYYYQLEG